MDQFITKEVFLERVVDRLSLIWDGGKRTDMLIQLNVEGECPYDLKKKSAPKVRVTEMGL